MLRTDLSRTLRSYNALQLLTRSRSYGGPGPSTMHIDRRFGNRIQLISHVATSHRSFGYRGFPDTMRSHNGSPRNVHGAEGGGDWMRNCTACDAIGQCCSACDASCQGCSACEDLSSLSSLHSHGAESDACSFIKPLTLSSLE